MKALDKLAHAMLAWTPRVRSSQHQAVHTGRAMLIVHMPAFTRYWETACPPASFGDVVVAASDGNNTASDNNAVADNTTASDSKQSTDNNTAADESRCTCGQSTCSYILHF